MTSSLHRSVFAAGVLTLAPTFAAEPPEQPPISVSVEPKQLDGERYVWNIVHTEAGQTILSSERIGFYRDNHWEFLSEPRRPAIRQLLVDGDTLWIASTSEIGRVALPLTRQSRYSPVNLPEFVDAGEPWGMLKSGERLIVVTNEVVWNIDVRTNQLRKTKLPNRSHLWLHRWNDRTLVHQPGARLWEVVGENLVAFDNPLPGSDTAPWVWTNTDFVLTTHGL